MVRSAVAVASARAPKNGSGGNRRAGTRKGEDGRGRVARSAASAR